MFDNNIVLNNGVKIPQLCIRYTLQLCIRYTLQLGYCKFINNIIS